MNVEFPVISCFHNKMCVETEKTIGILGGKFISGNRFIQQELSANEKPAWIIDSSGKLLRLSVIGKRHEFLRPLAFIWPFTRSIFSITTEADVTIEYVKDLASSARKNAISKDFIRHLNSFDSNEKLTKEMLVSWPI